MSLAVWDWLIGRHEPDQESERRIAAAEGRLAAEEMRARECAQRIRSMSPPHGLAAVEASADDAFAEARAALESIHDE